MSLYCFSLPHTLLCENHLRMGQGLTSGNSLTNVQKVLDKINLTVVNLKFFNFKGALEICRILIRQINILPKTCSIESPFLPKSQLVKFNDSSNFQFVKPN